MAIIEVRGYFNKPQARDSAGGGFQTFTLAEKQKGQRGGPDTRNFYDCTLFADKANGHVVEDGQYGTVKGYLNFREYEKDGQKRRSASINVQSIELAEPLAPKAGSAPAAPAADPFGVPGDDGKIPF